MILMRVQIGVGSRRMKTSFLFINPHIPNSRVHESIPIKRFQMRQKACSQIAVPAPPFVNDETSCRRVCLGLFALRLVTLLYTIVVVGRQGMRQTIVRRRKCLIELAKAPAAQAIEDTINMGLPLIDGAKLTDELWKGVGIIEYAGRSHRESVTNGGAASQY